MTSLTLEQVRAIDRCKEVLVSAAEKFLDDAGAIQLTQKEFGHSQLRNLIAVANETDSPAVVMNFIRYQMGRDSKKKNWSWKYGDQRLGDRLLADLGGAEGTVRQALLKIPDLDEPSKKQLATTELIRYYLGFASRYLKYLDLQRRKG